VPANAPQQNPPGPKVPKWAVRSRWALSGPKILRAGRDGDRTPDYGADSRILRDTSPLSSYGAGANILSRMLRTGPWDRTSRGRIRSSRPQPKQRKIVSDCTPRPHKTVPAQKGHFGHERSRKHPSVPMGPFRPDALQSPPVLGCRSRFGPVEVRLASFGRERSVRKEALRDQSERKRAARDPAHGELHRRVQLEDGHRNGA
jgi:hypothetical protein